MMERLILALDVDGLTQAQVLLEQLKAHVKIFKVGIRLFTAEGPKVVEVIKAQGGKVFLDLKLHDIPSVVASTAKEGVRLGAFMLTLHASGGREMMEHAAKAVREEAAKRGVEKPILLGVTVLTSLDESHLRELAGTPRTLQEQVLTLAKLAQASGLDGVIASPFEIVAIRAVCGRQFLIVTPGIRPQGAMRDDQKRTLTAREAIEAGADYLVIGRPILQAPDPAAAARRILEEMAGKPTRSI